MESIIRKGPQAHPGGGRSLRRQTALRGLHGLYGGELPGAPKLEYSGCTMQPGWNIKFKKNGKNVCTLYPLDGYFICMILIGGDAMAEMEARLGDFTPYIQGKFRDTRIFQGSRWLYLEIREQAVEWDLEELVFLKLRSMGLTPGPAPEKGKRTAREKGKGTASEKGKEAALEKGKGMAPETVKGTAARGKGKRNEDEN